MTDAADVGRVAVVTGAGGGLGPACCAELAARGMTVIATDVDPAAAADVLDRLQVAGEAAALDVTSESDVDRLVGGIVQRHGRLDVLVNMAGILRNARLVKLDDESFKLTLDIHVLGTMHTMRAAARVMTQAGYGRIVNASSVASRGAFAGASYAAAKGAIESLTRTAALELGPKGVNVNAVAPGMVDSGMFRTVPEDYQQEQIARIPLGRPAQPEEVAACVGFLASGKASFVTGQILAICGGSTVGI